MRRLRAWLVVRGPDLGLAGVTLVVVASALVALAHSGAYGESYSPLNHTVSSLGERGVSDLAPLFDMAMVIGGLLIALFMLSIAVASTDRAGRGFGLLGAAASLAMSGVGLYPVDDLEPHIVAAALAFGLITLASAWFAVWVLRGSAPYPKWLGWFAVWISVAMVLFLFLPARLQPGYSFEMDFSEQLPRPEMLLNALLEWVVVLSVWLWVAALAWHYRRMETT